MASSGKNKDADTDGEAPPPAGKSKKKLIIIVAVGVVVLALIGAGAFLLLKKPKGGEEGDAADAESSHQEKGHDQPPVYVKLDPFTTNLSPEAGELATTAGQYIQVVVEMKVTDPKDEEAIKQYVPEIRNNILRLLSSKHASQLASTEGKDQLASEIRNSVNGVIDPGAQKAEKGPSGPVRNVLFSSFIIQ